MLVRLILQTLAVGITAWLLPGIGLSAWWAAVLVAVVLGLINTFIRPIVKFFSLPLNIVTLGLFTFVINALMVLLCGWILEDAFVVEGFWYAMLFSVVLSAISWVLNLIFKKNK